MQINAARRTHAYKGLVTTGTLMTNAQALRDMAAWWRSFAETAGNAQTRRNRLDWAAHLEALADKEPRAQQPDVLGARTTSR